MHKLFPDRIPADDPTGERSWEYDWSVNNTGSKWFPDVYVDSREDQDMTRLSYDTARAPNNGTLQRLHELTSWSIENEYDEPGCQLEGTFTCQCGTCHDEEREYRTVCEICEQKRPEEAFDEELDGLICNDCRRKTNRLS